ncbi:hypothetical protein Krad_2764 [Kineococcus radiotolerans SRS30216 = ATCC BAA-149]|uniref:Uncharacterized protein n=1 Tax=Kineococcus radiotolerans (strain ATCC BAA-149 / DSM 14245 / SRS30216) TaxID=266940 RepID=A6WBP6_KINRD|nr:hypothetical protein Krad_2764 [Kineococcus radiotolerans SRS30216 = ATCC BAA-149]
MPSARVFSVKRSTEAAETPSSVLRCYIDSWEIRGGAPRPTVGQPLNGYRMVFRPSDPQDVYGLAALDEDLDVDALPPQVVVPAEARGGVRRGHCRRSGTSHPAKNRSTTLTNCRG